MDSEDGDKIFYLRENKRRRGNSKGNITNVIHAYEPYKTYTLKEISIEELTKLRQSAEEAVRNYEEIQSVIMF